MRPLEQLPHRFWPKDRLPEGVKPRSKFSNQKIAKLKSAYGKAVSPVLRAEGFRCVGTKGSRQQEWLWQGTWLLGGKYGGKAWILMCAHPPGFPARNEYEVRAPFEVPQCLFKRPVRFFDDPAGDEFDLGTAAETAETVEIMAEAVADDGVAYLRRLDTARERLLSITAETYDALMPETHTELGLSVTDSAFENAERARLELSLFLLRIHREAGTDAVAGLAEAGLAAFEEQTELRGTKHYLIKNLLERLPGGGPLHATDEEKQAAEAAWRADQ